MDIFGASITMSLGFYFSNSGMLSRLLKEELFFFPPNIQYSTSKAILRKMRRNNLEAFIQVSLNHLRPFLAKAKEQYSSQSVLLPTMPFYNILSLNLHNSPMKDMYPGLTEVTVLAFRYTNDVICSSESWPRLCHTDVLAS